MRFCCPLAVLLCFVCPLAALRAEDLPRAKAMEETAVRALVGKKSIITGKVTDAFESPKGMTFLNLEGGKFTVITWKDRYDKFEGGSPAKLYKGKTIEVTGTVIEFRKQGAAKEDPGKLEIKLNSPEQVKILASDATPATPSEPAPVEPAPVEAAPEKPAPADAAKPAAEQAKPAGDAKPARVDAKKYFK